MKKMNVFAGFPEATFRFLDELEQNNHRSWFQANSQLADEVLIRPGQEFLSEFGERARRIYPGLVYDPRPNGAGSMFRLSRDTRFSHDKSPFKTNLGFRFWLNPADRLSKRVRLYVHLDKQGVRVYGGEHCQMTSAGLAQLREAIADDDKGALKRIISNLERASFSLDNEKLSRVPRPYPADHPNADLLRLKSLHAISPVLSREDAQHPSIVSQCVDHAVALKPLNDWLDWI